MNYATSADGTRIAYDILGAGPKLLYITGAICHRNFKPVLDDAKYFASAFSVINYDRRGRGDSGDNPPYSVEREIDDIKAIIDSVGGKVNVYGHSSGAILAMESALRLPDKIEKVFIYDPSYVEDEQAKIAYRSLADEVNSLISKREHAKALRRFLIGIGMPRFFVLLLPLLPGWSKLKALAPTLSYDMDLTKDPPPLAQLAKIKLPMKIAYGQKSPDSIRSVSKAISQAIPAAALIEVANQDHMVGAKAILPLLKDFFK